MAANNSVLQVYGGDEVAALVLDPGSHTTRVGFAGEDCPRVILPSYTRFDELADDAMDVDDTGNSKVPKRVNTFFSEQQIEYPKENSELKPILKDSIIQDWDSALEQWQYSFDSLSVDYEEQPLLLTEPVWNTTSNRTKSLEIALELFQFPAFYFVSSPTCVAFAVGRPNVLVVDIGHDITSVTPVIDGMCLAKTTLKTHYAGRYLSAQLSKRLETLGVDLVPSYKVLSKSITQFKSSPEWVPRAFQNITKSFDDYQVEKTLHQLKESLLKVPADSIASDEDSEELFPVRNYELPNGNIIELGKERFEVGDSLFDPESYQIPEFKPESGEPEINSENDYVPLKRAKPKSSEDEEEASNRNAKKVPDFRGIGALTAHALALVDVDLRAQLAHNIIVTGASSLIPGLNDRLTTELNKYHPGLKIRVHSSGNTMERKFQSWIGGSVLSSLGTFHQLWVSKKEFDEVGADKLLAQRFR